MLGYRPRSKLPITASAPVLSDVTIANGILADPVEGFGPCLNDEGETDAPVRFPGRPCNLFPQLASGAGDISSRAGHYAGPVFAPGHWCVARITERRRASQGRRDPELFPRCGRAGKGDGTGYWDVAQNHARIEQVSRQVTKPEPSPSRVPMISASLPRGSIRGDGDAC